MNRTFPSLALLLLVTLAVAQQDAAPAGATLDLRVIEGVEVKLPDRSIIFRRVEPLPPVTVRPLQPQPEAKPLSREEAAAAEARAKKKFDVLMVSATVYDHRVTELRWWFENREYRAWSNVDFNLLAGAGGIETEDAVYLLMMGLGNDASESVAAANRRAAAEGLDWRKEPPRRRVSIRPARSTFSSPPAATPSLRRKRSPRWTLCTATTRRTAPALPTDTPRGKRPMPNGRSGSRNIRPRPKTQ